MNSIVEIDEDTTEKAVSDNDQAQEQYPNVTQQSIDGNCSIWSEENPEVENVETTPEIVPRKRGRPRKRPLNSEEVFPVTKKKEKQTKETKSKRKSDPPKPQFVGGVPVNPLQGEKSAIKNPYNYDPLTELVGLGQGQLVSAYRNTKNNIHLSKEKKMYRLDHKHSDDIQEDTTDASGDRQMIGSPERPEEQYGH